MPPFRRLIASRDAIRIAEHAQGYGYPRFADNDVVQFLVEEALRRKLEHREYLDKRRRFEEHAVREAQALAMESLG